MVSDSIPQVANLGVYNVDVQYTIQLLFIILYREKQVVQWTLALSESISSMNL